MDNFFVPTAEVHCSKNLSFLASYSPAAGLSCYSNCAYAAGSRALRAPMHLRQRFACTDQWGLSQTPLENPPSSPILPQISRTLRIQIPYPIANNLITRTSSFKMPYRIDKQVNTQTFSIQISQYVALQLLSLIRKGTEEVPYQRVLVEGAGSQSGTL